MSTEASTSAGVSIRGSLSPSPLDSTSASVNKSAPSDDGNDVIKKRSRVVCTGCRQMKLKCDAKQTSPHPCTRCVKTNTPCYVDPSFKRTARRQAASNHAPAPSRAGFLPPSDVPQAREPAQLPPPSISHMTLERGGEFSVGAVHVTAIQASMLFGEFFDVYHPFCPIFLYRRDPTTVYLSDPFLFWTILAIAARRPSVAGIEHSIDFSAITVEVSRMAAAFGMEPSRSLGTVQGLLLLCEWPFPSTSLKDDRSWYYVGLALQTALQNGLHRPQFAHEYMMKKIPSESIEGRERTLAYIFCYILSHSVSADHGLPSFAKDNWLISEAAAISTGGDTPPWLAGIPTEVFQLLRLTRLSRRATDVLGDSCDFPSGQAQGPSAKSMFLSLESELTMLERTIGCDSVYATAHTHLSWIKLGILGMQMPNTDDLWRAKVGGACYDRCRKLIDFVVSFQPEDFARQPRSVFFGCGVTCITLVRLAASPQSRQVPELVADALTSVSNAYRMIQSLSIVPHDLPSRFAQILAFTARQAQIRHEAPRDQLTRTSKNFSRMGAANWLWDSIVAIKSGVPTFDAIPRPAAKGPVVAVASTSPTTSVPVAPPPTVADELMNLAGPSEPSSGLDMMGGSNGAYYSFTTNEFDEILASLAAGDWDRPVDPNALQF